MAETETGEEDWETEKAWGLIASGGLPFSEIGIPGVLHLARGMGWHGGSWEPRRSS